MAERRDVEAFHDVQHLERDEALRARRHLEHVVAAIVGRDRIDPVGLVIGEVAQLEQPVARLHVGDDRAARSIPCRTRRVRPCAIISSDARQPRVREDVAVRGRPALRQERGRRWRDRRRASARCRSTRWPSARRRESRHARTRSPARSASASAIVPNRVSNWCQPSTTPGTSTTSGPRLGISVRPRFAYSAGVAAYAERPVESRPWTCLRFRVVDDRQQVAADAVHARLDDGEHGGGGDGGIDRVAAVLQHAQAGRRGERLARRDHAAPPDRGRARAANVSRRAIAGWICLLIKCSSIANWPRHCGRNCSEFAC